MIQPEDNKTLDLLEPVKRPRGRPSTGAAMSAADRKRASRRRQVMDQDLRQLNVSVSSDAFLALGRSAAHRGLNLSQLIEQLAAFAQEDDLSVIVGDDAVRDYFLGCFK